jgi:outer membrane protein TolC
MSDASPAVRVVGLRTRFLGAVLGRRTGPGATAALLSAILLWAGHAAATPPGLPAARPVSARDAVALVLAHDPALAAARAAEARARASRLASRARFTPLLSAGLDYSRATTTSLAQQGVLLGDADLATARGGFSWLLPAGTTLSAELGLRLEQRAFVSPILNSPLRIGPGYGVSLRVGAVQPLLRGLGETLGRLPEASAGVAVDAASRMTLRAASERVREVLGAHAELWLAGRTVALRTEARAVAKQARDEARLRAEAGDLGAPEVLPLEAELASAEEACVLAEAERVERQIALARLLGLSLSEAGTLEAEAPATSLGEPDSVDALVEASLANAATRAERDAAVSQAELSLVAARDRLRPRVDAAAWVEAAGLGDKDPLAALGMWGQLRATSAFIGLSLELPADRTSLESEVAAARHALSEAAHLREAETRRIEAETRALAARWQSAVTRRGLAERTAAAALAAADAFATRREAGAVTTLVWLQMTREAHAAALRVASLTVEALQAALSAHHAAGTLLSSVSLERAPSGPTTPGP